MFKKLKIIISTFNREKELSNLIDSIIISLTHFKNQYEILIINDYPIKKIKNKWEKEKNILIKNNKVNHGKVWNILNELLNDKNLNNEFILWLDDKEEIDENNFQFLIKNLNCFEEYDVYSFGRQNKSLKKLKRKDFISSYLKFYYKKNRKEERCWLLKGSLFTDKIKQEIKNFIEKNAFIYDEYFIFKYFLNTQTYFFGDKILVSFEYKKDGITLNKKDWSKKYNYMVLQRSEEMIRKNISLRKKVAFLENFFIFNKKPTTNKFVFYISFPLFWLRKNILHK